MLKNKCLSAKRKIISITVKVLKLLLQRNDLYLFNAKHGFADNSKYLFEYYLQKGHKCLWVSCSQEDLLLVEKYCQKYPKAKVVLRNNIKLIYYFSQTKLVFITHSFNDIGDLLPPIPTIINLWHGIALKKMGYDSSFDHERFNLDKSNPYIESDYIIASSDITAKNLASALNFESSKVLPLGQPRNDILINPKDSHNFICDLRKGYLGPSSTDGKIFLYAPTFRDDSINALEIYKSVISSFEDNAFPQDILILRLHPNERILLSQITLSEKVKYSNQKDVQHDLLAADILISDYSGIVFDFRLLGKPIILYNPDYETYFENRNGFYFNYEDLFIYCMHCSTKKELNKLFSENLFLEVTELDKDPILSLQSSGLASPVIYEYFATINV